MSNNPTIHIYYKPHYPPISTSKLLEICSEYGPIKKSNIISPKNDSNETSQHATITYLNNEDAINAKETLSSRTTIEENGINYKITKVLSQEDINKQSKNRVILRNISFYAHEKDIRKVLEKKYGTVSNVHLPMVGGEDKKKTHRGFAFVVFDEYKDALSAVMDNKIVIKKRECSIEFSESKGDYMQKKKEQSGLKESEVDKDEEKVEEKMEDDNDDESVASSSSSSSSDSSISSSSDSSSSDSSSSIEQPKPKTDTKKAIFLHNLPFTITRKDITEELFPTYKSNIEKIFFPKDSNTGQMKGSAFVYFDDSTIASTILDLYANKNENDMSNILTLQGRTIQVSTPFSNNLSSITPKKDQTMDKRHLYLQHPSIPSRPNDDDVNIPQSDKYKRLQSKKDRNIKLKSPLFVINPKRLSIRNISKNISVMELRELISDALRHALDHEMVNLQDVVLHYQALGYTLNQIQYDDKLCNIPPYDPKTMHKFIRNVQILKNDKNTSKGFAFVDFEYHVHALAVLRQLDNNIQYSKMYAQGGNYAYKPSYQKKKKKGEGNEGYPRLIVEFAVENKAKMIKHETSQQKKILQRKEKKEMQKGDGKKRKSRGQKQREQKRKKRQLLQLQEGVETRISEPQKVNEKKDKTEKEKIKKPPKKKKKNDADGMQFDSLVSTYKKQLFSNYDEKNDGERRKRWFEDDD